MIILAVDPGRTTGWATYTPGLPSAVPSAEQAIDVEFIDRVIPWIADVATRTPLRIVVERFVISGGTMRKSRGDENWSIEQIGLLRHHARWAGAEFDLQSAGDAKKFATDARLKEIGWWMKGRDHANDALRHLLLNVARHHPEDLDRMLTTALEGVVPSDPDAWTKGS